MFYGLFSRGSKIAIFALAKIGSHVFIRSDFISYVTLIGILPNNLFQREMQGRKFNFQAIQISKYNFYEQEMISSMYQT